MSVARLQRTVLVVEDDARLRELYRSALTEAGFTVVGVADGIDALRVLESGHVPAVVVLDLRLQRLSGSDFGRELKARVQTRHVPIVVVTGTDATHIEGIAVECVLHKPILPERLIEVVHRCVRKVSAV